MYSGVCTSVAIQQTMNGRTFKSTKAMIDNLTLHIKDKNTVCSVTLWIFVSRLVTKCLVTKQAGNQERWNPWWLLRNCFCMICVAPAVRGHSEGQPDCMFQKAGTAAARLKTTAVIPGDPLGPLLVGVLCGRQMNDNLHFVWLPAFHFESCLELREMGEKDSWNISQPFCTKCSLKIEVVQQNRTERIWDPEASWRMTKGQNSWLNYHKCDMLFVMDKAPCCSWIY